MIDDDTEFDPEHMSWIPGPVWPDGCEHEAGSYIGSFQIYRWNKQEKENVRAHKFDLYVFNQPNCGQEVCIRYGAEGSEYISPGRLVDFVKTAGAAWARGGGPEEYVKALEMLEAKGSFHWTPVVKVKLPPIAMMPLIGESLHSNVIPLTLEDAKEFLKPAA